MTLYSDKMVEHWEWFIMFVIKRIEVCGRIWKKYWIKRFMMKNGYCCHKCKINIENKHLLKFTCEYIRESMIKKRGKPLNFHTQTHVSQFIDFLYVSFLPSKSLETLLLFLVSSKWQFFILISCFSSALFVCFCVLIQILKIYERKIFYFHSQNWSIKKFQFFQVRCWILWM